MNVQCFDVPIGSDMQIDRIGAFARVSTRTNATILKDKKYVSVKTFSGYFNIDSSCQLMSNWLNCEENKSLLKDHIFVMRTIQAIAMTIQKPGNPITLDLV